MEKQFIIRYAKDEARTMTDVDLGVVIPRFRFNRGLVYKFRIYRKRKFAVGLEVDCQFLHGNFLRFFLQPSYHCSCHPCFLLF